MELELWLAVYSGDVEEVKEILRMNPKPKVNALSDHGSTALIEACDFDWDAIVAILLAHPDIDVNHKDSLGITPLARACFKGSTSSVRLLLKDPRVKVNEPNGGGYTPLWLAASKGHLGVIKWWFASERVVDLGEPGANSDVIKWAKAMGRTEVVALLENFRENPEKARYTARAEFGLIDDLAAQMFALLVFVSGGLLQVRGTTSTPAARFFTRLLPIVGSRRLSPAGSPQGIMPSNRFFQIAARLPLELQMVLSFRLVGSAKEIIPGKSSEFAFKKLAKGSH